VDIAEGIVGAAGLYLLAGLAFALAFVTVGVSRVDPAARGGTWGFRVLILPGAAVLWPLLLVRWVRGRGPREERNAHRDAARADGVPGEAA
jgi:hypothetical protein